jgi:O-antigen/teichoic acid export membrane protein
MAAHPDERTPVDVVSEPVAAAPRWRRALGRLHVGAETTATGRADERHRRIATATVAGIGSRVLTAITLLVALPMAARHLNAEELGVWTLLVTAVALLGFADLGLGNGMLNVLTRAIGHDDTVTARRAVTGAVAGMTGIAVVGALVTAVLVPIVPWDQLLQVSEAEVPGLTAAIAVFAATVLIAIPSGVGQRIHLAYQQGWAASMTTAIGSALALAATAVAAVADASLPCFVGAMLVGPVLAYLGETTWVFVRSHPDLRPERASLHAATVRRILSAGGQFFALALAGAVAYQSDSLVIAHYLGAAEVTRYAVCLRLFTLVQTALAALLLPLWPAYGEAIASRDHDWVKDTLRRSLVASFALSVLSSLVLIVAARWLLSVWTPELAVPSTSLLLALACWAVVSSVSMAVAMFLNGANIIRLQVIAASVMAVANLGLSITLVTRIGIAGPVWASVVTQTLIVLVPVSIWILPSAVARGHVGTAAPATP